MVKMTAHGKQRLVLLLLLVLAPRNCFALKPSGNFKSAMLEKRGGDLKTSIHAKPLKHFSKEKWLPSAGLSLATTEGILLLSRMLSRSPVDIIVAVNGIRHEYDRYTSGSICCRSLDNKRVFRVLQEGGVKLEHRIRIVRIIELDDFSWANVNT